MKITVCIGSSCHIKGSRPVTSEGEAGVNQYAPGGGNTARRLFARRKPHAARPDTEKNKL